MFGKPVGGRPRLVFCRQTGEQFRTPRIRGYFLKTKQPHITPQMWVTSPVFSPDL